MENFNKVLSFILGLVVVVVFVAVFSGRLNLTGKLAPLTKGLAGRTSQISPIPIQSPSIPTQTPSENNRYQTVSQNTDQTSAIISIPKTGSPTFLQPLLVSTALLGLYLSRIKGK